MSASRRRHVTLLVWYISVVAVATTAGVNAARPSFDSLNGPKSPLRPKATLQQNSSTGTVSTADNDVGDESGSSVATDAGASVSIVDTADVHDTDATSPTPSPLPSGRLRVVGGTLVDSFGRAVALRGVNAVEKKHPFVPSARGPFNPTHSLGAEDARLLTRWGFNVVRLGVLWQAHEPEERGTYNATYLDAVAEVGGGG